MKGAAARKRALRLAMRARALMDPETARRAGERAADHLARTPEFAAAPRVALFAALPDEIPTEPLFDRVRAAGKIGLLPRIGRDDRLEFAAAEEWASLQRGAFGALEPDAAAVAIDLEPADLVVLPGLAFDARGGRLGRGSAYYDRTLSADGASLPILFGLAYAAQIVETVPMEEHDCRVEAVVSEAGVLRCQGAGATEGGRAPA